MDPFNPYRNIPQPIDGKQKNNGPTLTETISALSRSSWDSSSTEFVVNGAELKCMYGDKEAYAIGTCQGLSLGVERIVGKSDTKITGDFGYCEKLTERARREEPRAKEKQKCQACLADLWSNTEAATLISQQEAVTTQSTLSCKWGPHPEAITIESSGQGGGGTDELPTNMKEFWERYSWSSNANAYIEKRTGRVSLEAGRLYESWKLNRFSAEHITNEDLEFYNEMLRTGRHPVTGKKLTETERLNAQMMSMIRTYEPIVAALGLAYFTSLGDNDGSDIVVGKKASGANTPNPDVGVVQSRINVANGRTRFTPTRPSTGKPVSAGFEHVLDGHFNRPLANSRSIFSVTADRLKQILQSPNVVKSTVIDMSGGQYKRIVDTGEIMGNTALKYGGNPTSWIEVITDRAGNLITTYPVPKP